MDIVTISVFLILLVFIWNGYRKGFVRIAFSLVSIFLMFSFVSVVSPYVREIFTEQTSLYTDLEKYCTKKVEHLIEEKTGHTALHIEELHDNLESIPIPAIWMEKLVNQDIVGKTVAQQVGNYMADKIIGAVVFLGTMLLVAIIMKIILNMLDVFAKLPVIKSLNHLLGGLLGLAQGILLLWLLLFILALSCTTEIGCMILGYIQDNSFVMWLYQNNMFLYLIDFLI